MLGVKEELTHISNKLTPVVLKIIDQECINLYQLLNGSLLYMKETDKYRGLIRNLVAMVAGKNPSSEVSSEGASSSLIWIIPASSPNFWAADAIA